MAKAEIQTKTSMQTVLPSEAKHSITPDFLCTAGCEATSVYVAGVQAWQTGLSCDLRGPCSQVLSLWHIDLWVSQAWRDRDTEQIKLDNQSGFLVYTMDTKAQKGEETT